jgi:hypothetical protein
MKRYLGETIVDVSDTEYKDYTPQDWALQWIGEYGGVDGDHHKNWVLDQVVRILKGTKVIVKVGRWSDGQEEYRITLDEAPFEYHKWVQNICDGGDGPNTYHYDIGIAP